MFTKIVGFSQSTRTVPLLPLIYLLGEVVTLSGHLINALTNAGMDFRLEANMVQGYVFGVMFLCITNLSTFKEVFMR